MKNQFILLILLAFVRVNCFGIPDLEQHIKNKVDRTESMKSTAFEYVKKINNHPILKSALASKKMLDKITYPNGSYKTFAYNEAGLLIDYKFYEYDSWDETTTLQEHQEIEYDKNGNQTLFIDHNNDSFDGFIIVEKKEASYYENNIPREEINWEYNDSDNVLEKVGKSVYTLTDANNVKAEDYYWTKDTEEWTLSGKTEINFNDFEHPISVSTYNWSNSEYNLEEILEFKYNDRNLVIELIEKGVAEETGEIIDGLTITTKYNSEGNILNETASGMIMGELVVVYENIYSYEKGLLISEEYKSGFGDTKTEYSYIDGKLTEIREYYPDYDDNWVNQGLILQYIDQFTYDSSINFEELVYPSSLDKYYNSFSDFCDPFYFQYGAIENTICSSWDYNTESVIEKYRGSYHYSNFEAGVKKETGKNNLNRTNLKIGPNPCANMLNIFVADDSTVDLKISNSAGKLMMAKTINSKYTINTSLWEKGLYIITTPFQSYKLFKK